METPTKLQKKSSCVVEQACQKIEGFRELYQEMDDKIRLSDQSDSTLYNYARRMAQLSLHFGKLPHEISENEINKYLANLARQKNSPSLSEFKLTVFALRFCYRIKKLFDRIVLLPIIKHRSILPVVLNEAECKDLFQAPNSLRDRILLALVYSAGLRVGEASRLKISDIDSARMMIHIRQSKGKKDRYVPLAHLMLEPLRKYFRTYRPVTYLFNGRKPGLPLSIGGMQSILRKGVKNSKIRKEITLHTLRHSFATHLLEHGVDIVTIKELLGHKRIETTLVYLHVAMPTRSNLVSPFDWLYQKS